jgi:tRNA modification GTPase
MKYLFEYDAQRNPQQIYHGICPGKPPPKPRYATLRTLWTPEHAQILDANALILYFPGPNTVTGEDVLELHIHGGPAIVKAVLDAIPKSIGLEKSRSYPLRYAEPGEFTRRAFYNNRLDLTQVEALGDVLSAETEQQRRLAVRGASNALAKEYETWRKDLTLAQGELEALIDFSEDQHFDESPATFIESVVTQVEQLRTKLIVSIKNSARGELLRNGINVALLGAPNAGKSSLLNRIIGREAAIVSEEAGTTRDVVEVGIDIGGFYCKFGDLAGLRQIPQIRGSSSVGKIEQEGMRRAKERALAADVVIVVLSSEDLLQPNAEVIGTLNSCDMARQRVVFVVNKADLLKGHTKVQNFSSLLNAQPYLRHSSPDIPIFLISCKEAQFPQSRSGLDGQDPGGIQLFLRGLFKVFQEMTSTVFPEDPGWPASPSVWEQSLGASHRQRLLMQQCLQWLEAFLVEARASQSYRNGKISGEETEIDAVVAAENLRAAADCLAKITGKGQCGNVEEVLGVVFEKYDWLI